MKIMKRAFCVLLIAILMMVQMVPALAADEEYTYTFRLYAGNQGTIGGKDRIVVDNQKMGSTFFFVPENVTVKDSNKYVVVGIREAGKDNSEVIAASQSVYIDRDLDYVVAYAMKGDTVKYVVHYVDENGNEIQGYDAYGNIVYGHKEYYGIKNSSVVISPVYIEGYAPAVAFLRETLSVNEAENEFYYPYITNKDNTPGGNGGNGGNGGEEEGTPEEPAAEEPAVPTAPEVELPDVILPVPVTPVVPTIDAGIDDVNGNDQDANANDANGGENDADAADNGEAEEEDQAVEFAEIFDQDSPLAGMKKAVEYITQPGSPMAGWSAPAAVTTATLILLGIPALIIFLILFWKKKRDDEKDQKAKVQ